MFGIPKIGLRCAVVAVLAMILACGAFAAAPKKAPKPKSNTLKSGVARLGVTLGKPLYHQGLTVFPLLSKKADTGKFKTLKQAMKDGDIVVTEVSEGGSVPELRVRNKGKTKVLIMDGEELVGAKQNRIVNTSIIVDAKSEVTIPVSCVEHGRWTYKSDSFGAGEMAYAGLRARNAEKVQTSYKESKGYDADQQGVWDEVAKLNMSVGVRSDTGAMHDSYKKLDADLKKFEKAFPMPKNAVGYVAFSGKTLLSGDIFGSPVLLRQNWGQIVRSLAMDMIHSGGKPPKTSPKTAGAQVEKILNATGAAYVPPGAGSGYQVNTTDTVGNTLMENGDIVHMSIFQKQ